jgi:hypothetical protein
MLAIVFAALWLAFAPATPDLAAQVFRAELFERDGFAVWNAQWYGGHHTPGYSLLSPPLSALLGARLVGAIAAVVAAALFERLARAHFGSRAVLATWVFAAATACDLLIGRVTYALGMTIALGALLALQRGRPRLAVALAALCCAGSPVAGLFLALAGVAIALGSGRDDERLRRRGLALAAAAFAPAAFLALAFPEGGTQGFANAEALRVLAACAILLAWLPRGERTLRVGTALYALASIGSFLLPTPMGGNATRLGATFAAPLLLCLFTRRDLRKPACAAALAFLLIWQWTAPLHETSKGGDDPSAGAAYYTPLLSYLERAGAADGRVEVPFTRMHWEAVHVAQRFALARGWERQLDRRYNGLFYEKRLRPADYERWLRSEGVRFVAVPDVALDPAGKREALLIARRPAFLRPVWRSRHWRVYEVTDHTTMASGGARVRNLDSEGFTLLAPRTGRFRVRVHWSPYWAVAEGGACLAPGADGWLRVAVLRAGPTRIENRFSVPRLLDRGPRCGASA